MYKSTIEPEYLRNFCEPLPWPFDEVGAGGIPVGGALQPLASVSHRFSAALAFSKLE